MQKAAVNYSDCENIPEQALNHLGFPEPLGISRYLGAWRTLLDIRVPTPCTPLTHLLSSIGCCRPRSKICSVNPEVLAASYLQISCLMWRARHKAATALWKIAEINPYFLLKHSTASSDRQLTPAAM